MVIRFIIIEINLFFIFLSRKEAHLLVELYFKYYVYLEGMWLEKKYLFLVAIFNCNVYLIIIDIFDISLLGQFE